MIAFFQKRPLILALFSILQILHAQNVIINEAVQEGQAQSSKTPFLSTTVSAKITYKSESSSSSLLHFDSARKAIFSGSLTDFLTKIFSDQQVYDLKIIGVNIFDDQIMHNGQYDQGTTVGHQEGHAGEMIGDGNQPVALSFSMVISAEYTSEIQMDTISSETFRKMLIHVCDKFQSHLLRYMQEETGDPYFMDVESIVLGEFDKVEGDAGKRGGQAAIEKEEMSVETMHVASIVAIVVGGIMFTVLSFATIKYYQKEKELKAARWRSKEMGSLHPTRPSSISSSLAVVDDYSFNPSDSINGLNTKISFYKDNRENPKRAFPRYLRDDDEEIAFSSVNFMDNPNYKNPNDEETGSPFVLPELATPRTIFPDRGAVAAPMSYTEELRHLPQQHVFAPPGKIGVAIDVLNGQPVVHKVRKGSPLEKMLQPNDVIMAIDDEDMSCMSAADVTSKMVRRMDRVRKITFVRRPLEL